MAGMFRAAMSFFWHGGIYLTGMWGPTTGIFAYLVHYSVNKQENVKRKLETATAMAVKHFQFLSDELSGVFTVKISSDEGRKQF